MLGFLKRSVTNLLNRYPAWLCREEYASNKFTRFNERPVEFAFIFRTISELYPRNILDVGTGTTALPHLMQNCGCLVTAIDNIRDYWPTGMSNRHFHIIDDDITATQLTGSFDLITCVSVLEHIESPDNAVRNMFSLLRPGGHIILTTPYSEGKYVRNVYDLPGSSYGKGSPYITQAYCRDDLNRWLRDNGGTIVDQEFWNYWTGEHWTVGTQIIPPLKTTTIDRHQLTCVLIRKE